MSRPASPETQLRAAKRSIKVLQLQVRATESERNSWRKRAEKAEAEVVEWKARFDKLLERNPLPGDHHGT